MFTSEKKHLEGLWSGEARRAAKEIYTRCGKGGANNSIKRAKATLITCFGLLALP